MSELGTRVSVCVGATSLHLSEFFKLIGFTDSHTMGPLNMPFPRPQLRALTQRWSDDDVDDGIWAKRKEKVEGRQEEGMGGDVGGIRIWVNEVRFVCWAAAPVSLRYTDRIYCSSNPETQKLNCPLSRTHKNPQLLWCYSKIGLSLVASSVEVLRLVNGTWNLRKFRKFCKTI